MILTVLLVLSIILITFRKFQKHHSCFSLIGNEIEIALMGHDETNESINCSNTLTQYEGKVDLLTQPISESDSEFGNLLKPLVIELKKAYPEYYSPGKSVNSYINCKGQMISKANY